MFYDLNIPWSPTDAQLPRTLAFAHELGYNVIALTHTISGALPSNAAPTNPIPDPLPFPVPPTLHILRRVTLQLTATPPPNARLAALANAYDLLAVQPVDERSFTLACKSLDCDVVTLDLAVRWSFYFPAKLVAEAVRAGKKFEICYGGGIGGGGGAEGRRLVVQNATQLVRATKGKGVVVSSGAGGVKGPAGLRAPWDVVNLCGVWGLSRERAGEAVGSEARGAVVAAGVRRSSYRGVVGVVFGGERVEEEQGEGNKKRKAGEAGIEGEKQIPLSKTQMRKRAKQAKMEKEVATTAPK